MAFLQLSARRQSGMAVNPLTYGELEAFCRLTKVEFSAWQVSVLMRLDDLATVLVDALGLTQQFGAAVDDDPDAPVPYFGPTTRLTAQIEAEELEGGHVVTRWATKWERADG